MNKKFLIIAILLLFIPSLTEAEVGNFDLKLPYLDTEVYRVSRAYGIGYHVNKDFYALDFADPTGNPENIYQDSFQYP